MKKKEKNNQSQIADTPKREKKSEGEITHEEELFRAFVEHSSDIISSPNLEGTIIYINRRWSKFLDSVEERIGAKDLSLFIRMT